MVMNRIALAATVVVILNLLVATAHGLSHAEAGVPLEPWQHAFVRVVVYASPILAAMLYWTTWRRFGVVLLIVAMLAGTVFGIYFHFVADTIDHVAQRSSDGSGTLFVVTAVLLVPANALGAAFGVWSWYRLGKATA
jgi:hypothetical protein